MNDENSPSIISYEGINPNREDPLSTLRALRENATPSDDDIVLTRPDDRWLLEHGEKALETAYERIQELEAIEEQHRSLNGRLRARIATLESRLHHSIQSLNFALQEGEDQ